MKLVVGITGNFGTGKTTVANFFKACGAHVINADKIVHEIYRNDKRIQKKIRQTFGSGVFRKGTIDRGELARAAFSKGRLLGKLCNIVYPETVKKISERLKKSKKSINILDAPMLIESGLNNYVDYIVVVCASKRNQMRRCASLGFAPDEIGKRLLFQMPSTKKIKFADFVINNNRSKEHVRKEVKKIWRKLKRR
ncbi:MAG: dephospho-CoA kinase [Candidatus Omnitrophica bacterium]|nr:dephospho-CoA kinase [Candidatus Omnitrophota bacterium]